MGRHLCNSLVQVLLGFDIAVTLESKSHRSGAHISEMSFLSLYYDPQG
jgi:hypothetical protein